MKETDVLKNRIQFGKYRKLAEYGRKYKRTIALMVASGVALTGLQVAIPLLIGSAVTIILASKSQLQSVLLISLEIIGLSSASAVFQFTLGYGGQYLGQKVIYDMRNKLFTAIQGSRSASTTKTRQGSSWPERQETSKQSGGFLPLALLRYLVK